jgi:hypothetical protein
MCSQLRKLFTALEVSSVLDSRAYREYDAAITDCTNRLERDLLWKQ